MTDLMLFAQAAQKEAPYDEDLQKEQRLTIRDIVSKSMLEAIAAQTQHFEPFIKYRDALEPALECLILIGVSFFSISTLLSIGNKSFYVLQDKNQTFFWQLFHPSQVLRDNVGLLQKKGKNFYGH